MEENTKGFLKWTFYYEHHVIMEEFNGMGDIFDHHYYRIVKFLGIITGEWPYRGRLNNIMRFLVIVGASFQMFTQVLGIIHYIDDSEIIWAVLPMTVIECSCIWKFTNTVTQSSNMRKLLDWMKEDWTLVNDEERQILHKYAQVGKLFATTYAACAFFTLGSVLTQPVMDDMIGKMLDENYTMPEQGYYPIEVYYYGLNVGKIYYVTLLVSYLNISALATVSISQDTLFIVYIQHVCGRFAALGYTVENLPFSKDSSEDEGFKYVCKCIATHNRTLKFSDTVESAYVWYYLGVVALNMIDLSLTAFLIVTQARTIQFAVKLILLFNLQVIHFFFQCYMAQKLVNHSEDIQTSIENAPWYNHSMKTQKLLVFMLMRSQIPCRITAGKILDLSMETFSSICKTSASYFMVFQSMQ